MAVINVIKIGIAGLGGYFIYTGLVQVGKLLTLKERGVKLPLHQYFEASMYFLVGAFTFFLALTV